MKHAVLAMLIAACSEPRTTREPCTGDACTPRVHPAGILDPASDDFHAKELARVGWDLNLCASCHGQDFTGGAATVSCLGCHTQGPTACVTCHGPGAIEAPAGNHAPHLAAGLDCSACHVKPASWDAPGHVLGDAPPAEVTFGALAQLTPVPGARKGPATWDGARCTNVYCHGDVTPRLAASDPEPRWDEPVPAFTCDRCHGAPPPEHIRVDCVSCHPGGAAHVDGVVEVVATPTTERAIPWSHPRSPIRWR